MAIPDPLTIRRVTPADVDLYRTVRLAALKDSPSAFGTTHAEALAMPDTEWSERTTRASAGIDRVLFLALAADTVVGLSGGYRDELATVEVVSVWAAPEVRGTGTGRALVTAVLEWAADTGAETVELWVTDGNEPARRAYLSLGFEITTDVQPHSSDPCANEVRMRRRLTKGDG